jgi:hypothetical protein
MDAIKLSKIEISDLKRIDAWKILESTYDDEDMTLIPAEKNRQGFITRENGDLWCWCKATFANGALHDAIALCRGDSDQGPMLWTFWNGEDVVGLMVPPAPDFVLEVDGPANFCQEFSESAENVFPISLEAVPKFEVAPTIRRITIYAEGAIV